MYGFDGLLDSEICPSRESRLNPEDASGIALQRRSEPNLSDVWLETRLPPKGHNQPDHISECDPGTCHHQPKLDAFGPKIFALAKLPLHLPWANGPGFQILRSRRLQLTRKYAWMEGIGADSGLDATRSVRHEKRIPCFNELLGSLPKT